jgi:hypothetical protein
MRTNMLKALLALNEILADVSPGVTDDPPNEHMQEALKLLRLAQDMLRRAENELHRSDMEKIDG